VTQNLYAPPKAAVADVPVNRESPALWNPNSAANWSLIFSPAFGAFLHMKNWEALGEPAKASAAKIWVAVTLVALIGIATAAALLPGARFVDALLRAVGVVLLLSWYFSSGRAQTAYVKSRFGKSYPKRGWGKPLLLASLAVIAFFVYVAAVAFATLALTHGA
jgi:hypothetical protein